MKFLCTATEKIVFLYWKGTADEYDDKFTSWVEFDRLFESEAECEAES